MPRRLILTTLTPILVALLTLFSFFMLLRGHEQPGGGFVGGLLLAGAVAIYSLAHGPTGARRLLRLRPESFVGGGLLLAVLSGLIGPITGHELFATWELGKIPGLTSVGTVTLFDLGVYMVVHGTVSGLLIALEEL